MPDDAGFVIDMRTSTPALHRFTVAEVRGLQAAGMMSPDFSIELLDGELYGMPSEGELHRDYKIEIGRFFIRALPDELRAAVDTTLMLSATEAPDLTSTSSTPTLGPNPWRSADCIWSWRSPTPRSSTT